MDDLARAGLGPRPFARWSQRSDDHELPADARTWLSERLGTLTPQTPVDEASIGIPRSELPIPARKELADAIGEQHVDESSEARRAHAGGQSYADLVRRRGGISVAFPDAVVRPNSHDTVAEVLAICHAHRIAVVPYGGGTSVVGGVEPARGRHYGTICLDLTRMDQLIALDQTARTATFQPGITGPRVEELLGQHGLTLGHVPQSFAHASLGGYVATRSAGQASTGYGRIGDLVVDLRVATPTGSTRLGTGTPNAAGPDLRALFIGSEGVLGVITEITVRVRPEPEERRYELWALPSFARGAECLRALEQAGRGPDVVRLSDETETEVTLALRGRHERGLSRWLRLRGIRSPAFLIMGWEDARARVRDRGATARAIVGRHGGVSLGRKGGEAWRAHRFAGPHQRDVLLDLGVLVETLETATTWSRLDALYAGVRLALETELTRMETPPVVMTHLSHLYPTGASLYFTVLARGVDSPNGTLWQWSRAKAAASDTIVELSGTISHHHAVGRDHAGYLSAEIGDVGLRALAAVKAERPSQHHESRRPPAGSGRPLGIDP